MNPLPNTWNLPNIPNTAQDTSKGVFATFVDGENAVKNYLVPAGGMAILIDINGGKMWFKSVNINGVPAPVRTFTIKEIPLPVPAGSNVVTRTEFNELSKQFHDISEQILAALGKKTEEKTK